MLLALALLSACSKPSPGVDGAALEGEMRAVADALRADFPAGARVLALVERGWEMEPSAFDQLRLEALARLLPSDRYPLTLAGPDPQSVSNPDDLTTAVYYGWPRSHLRQWLQAHPSDAVVALLRLPERPDADWPPIYRAGPAGPVAP